MKLSHPLLTLGFGFFSGFSLSTQQNDYSLGLKVWYHEKWRSIQWHLPSKKRVRPHPKNDQWFDQAPLSSSPSNR